MSTIQNGFNYTSSTQLMEENESSKNMQNTSALNYLNEESMCSSTIGSLMILSMIFVLMVTFPFSLFFCLTVVHDHERAVVFRNGKLLSGKALGPGVVFVIPLIDNYCIVDLRTVCYDVPPQQILTKDSITVTVDAVLLFHIHNAIVAITNVEDYGCATKLLVASTLRTILGTKTLAEILESSQTISENLKQILDETTVFWGVKVERIDIKNVRLPQHLQRAMAAEAQAGREARAKLIEAKGEQMASRSLVEAANVMQSMPACMQFRYLQTLSTISANNNRTIAIPFPIELFQYNNNDHHSDNTEDVNSFDNITESLTTTLNTLTTSGSQLQPLSCHQHNGQSGVCRPTNSCLSQQPTQKVWNVCEWADSEPMPTTVCCDEFDGGHHSQSVATNQTDSESENDIHNDYLKNVEHICGRPSIELSDKSNFSTYRDEVFRRSKWKRIVNGNDCAVGQIPWIVSIYYRGEFLCGGSILSETHCVTAAHCFDKSLNADEYVVRTNSVQLYNGTKYGVSRIRVHKQYRPPKIYNDIAIIKLKNAIHFNQYVSPVCAPKLDMSAQHIVDHQVFVAGFGDVSFGGSQAAILQEVDLRVVNTNNCSNNYRNLIVSNRKFPHGFKSSLLCAGHSEGKNDACQGDSGGPLTLYRNGKYYLIGLVSFGYKCALPAYPGVYTSIAYYLSWIQNNMV